MKEAENRLKADRTERAVLDAYFSLRSPRDGEFMSMVEERKTTLQVQDDLRSTLEIEDVVIVDYMLHHGYLLIPDDDGSPIWRLFRLP